MAALAAIAVWDTGRAFCLHIGRHRSGAIERGRPVNEMKRHSQAKMKDRFLFVFTDKFMFLWLMLAVAGILTVRFHKVIGIILCLPAVLFFTTVFVMLIIANHRHKTKDK